MAAENGSNGGGGGSRSELMEMARTLETDAVAAETRLRDFLQRHPGEVNASYLLAISLRLQERYEESLAVFGDVITAAPEFPAARQELGQTLFEIGHFEPAAVHLKEAVRLEPRLEVAWRLLGDTLREMGDHPGARDAHQKAHEVSKAKTGMANSGIAPLVQEARAALQQGNAQRADQLCRNQLEVNPNDVWALRTLAEVGIGLNAYNDARSILEVALSIDPEFHEARTLLASVLQSLNEYTEALEHLDILAEKEPGNPNNGAIRAKVLAELNDIDSALDIYSDLVEFYPKKPAILLDYGHTLRIAGHHDKAVETYRAGLDMTRTFGDFWFALANLKTYDFSDAEIDEMKALLSNGAMIAQSRALVGFALGAALEAKERWAEAADAFAIANDAQRSFAQWDADANTRLTLDLKSTFTAAYFATHKDVGSQKADPIFVVGLPRAGSTLVEHILAAHSDVDSTMELPDIPYLTRRVGGSTGPNVLSKYPQIVSTLPEPDFEALGEEYLARVLPRRAWASHFIDKLPGNFQHIGFIKSILPNAKVIDVRRSPMSTCYSLWKMSFAIGREYAYNQSDIARYYLDYIDLMDHWHQVLPGFVHEVSYEKIVTDTEAEVRKLLDFCGLPFEEACLRPHETERTVRTASSEQVRQPIYTSALEQWRHYADRLGDLRAGLAPLADRFDLD